MRRGIEGLALGFAGPPIPRWGAQHDSSPASILHGWGGLPKAPSMQHSLRSKLLLAPLLAGDGRADGCTTV